MGLIRTFAQKQNQPQKAASLARANRVTPGLRHREHPFLSLQRTIGNQAVLRMLQTRAEEPHAGLTVRAGNPAGLSRQEAKVPTVAPPIPEERPYVRVQITGHEYDDLLVKLLTLADKKVTNYVTYRDAISQSNDIERRVARNPVLLAELNETLDPLSFARCVESLGRRAPTFNELRNNSVVLAVLKDAWKASDVGRRDLVSQPHEEGGWIYMNLIDGSLSTIRAKPMFTDAIQLEPAPDVEKNLVLVGTFHTHPTLGRTAKPGSHDLTQDQRRGVPNLVAANTGNDPKVFQVYLSGPTARKHLADRDKFPGRAGGVPP